MVAFASLAADQFVGKVVGVSDGDTLKVMRTDAAVCVRLHGVDALEGKQPFATRARLFTSELAFGRTETVVVRDTDRYRRLVGVITLPDAGLVVQAIRSPIGNWKSLRGRLGGTAGFVGGCKPRGAVGVEVSAKAVTARAANHRASSVPARTSTPAGSVRIPRIFASQRQVGPCCSMALRDRPRIVIRRC